jgi:ribose 5-phosphate isomerase B
MRILLGSDEETPLARAVVSSLENRGHDVTTVGSLAGRSLAWSTIGRKIAESISGELADMGVGLCWTGTGIAMAANRIPRARAALCVDPQTATGARRWNDANILVLSNRITSPAMAEEILDAWFAAQVDPNEVANINELG